MRIKRFALLVLSVGVLSGFQAVKVSANEGDNTTQSTVAVSEVDETTTSTQEAVSQVVVQTPDVSEAIVPTATVQPQTATTQAVTKKKNTAKKKKGSKKKNKKVSYTKKELRLMASIINCEAGSEPYQGKIAVGVVVMNRVKSKSFPNTLKKVIYQKHQFSPVRNGSLKKRLRQYDAGKTKSKQWRDCISAAKKTLSGQKTVVLKGKVKNMKSYHFFSVGLSGARMKLGGHRFK